MATRSLLITGVSGYCGGTILTNLLRTKSITKDVQIYGLVRNEEQRAKIADLGVTPVLFDDWDQSDQLKGIAEGFDIIIHAGAGWHPGVAKALIAGLGKRREQTKNDVHYLHLSGTSSLSDYPHTEGWIESRTFSDEEDIYSYLKARESRKPYMVRETDIIVAEQGEFQGVQTYNIMAPTIFGIGSGLFNRYSIQIPVPAKVALESGHVSVIGNGETVWTHVHVEDLAMLFITLLKNILQGVAIPSGKQGIYFSETGSHTHIELAQRLAKAGKELDLLKTDEVRRVTLQEAADLWSGGVAFMTEFAHGSNARNKAVLGRKLGWDPRHGDEWESTFATEIAAIAANPPRSFEVPKLLEKDKS
ncbi:hypothetical protein NM208_g783 [Fusarium decemcellulare]|uniref:Uncharacterized protein n=1 Tax=Fusarium decemcellulare TaxID=57161 RepID=A0ACC1SYI3_9HYPO|nr:hypothetical protein NM208_g783 [Fusarium decemcellulare]